MSGSSLGSVAGFFIGNAILPGIGGAIGNVLGAAIGGALYPEHIKGPSIGDAQTQTSQAGVPRNVVFGHPAPFAGNLIDGERKARKVTKEVRQGKGGGPVVEEEHFYLTYCIRIGEPIGGVLRAWRQGKCVYDVRPLEAMPGWDDPETADAVAEYFEEMQAANQKFLDGKRFYLGSEDQLPDPALEMLHGVGNTPYYRGSSLLICEDEDVTDVGGATPVWMFECVSCAISTSAVAGFVFSGPTNQVTVGDGAAYDVFALPGGLTDSIRYMAVNGKTVLGTSFSGYVYRSRDGGKTWERLGNYAGTGQRIAYGNNRWVMTSWSGFTSQVRMYVSTDDGDTWVASSYFAGGFENDLCFGNGIFLYSTGGYYTSNLYGSYDGLNWFWISADEFQAIGFNGSEFLICRNDGANFWSTNPVAGLNLCAGVAHSLIYGIAATPIGGWLVCTFSGRVYTADAHGSTFTLRYTDPGGDPRRFYCAVMHENVAIVSTGGGGSGGQIISFDYGVTWGPISSSDVDPYNVDIVYTGDPLVGSVSVPDAPGSYVDPVTGQTSVPSPADLLEFCSDLTLQQVEEEIAARCNIPAGRFDASALAGILIPGYLLGRQATGAECLLPLCTAYFHDLPEPDGIVAVLRGAPAVEEITDAQLLLEDTDPFTQGQSLEYPLKVTVITQHPEADYAPVPQTSERYSPDVKAASEFTLSLPIPLPADETMAIAVKIHNVLWARAEGNEELALPRTHMHLLPSDAITRNNRRWLIEDSNRADRCNRLKVVYDRESNYHAVATGNTPQPPTPPGSGLIGPTILEFLNLPMLADSQDKVGFYVAGKGLFSSWKGAVLEGSIDNGVTWTDLGDIESASVMGQLESALADASEAVLDEVNTVRVNVGRGELNSITFDQLLMEQNACVIGDELCQFQTAIEVSDGLYDLTVLARGRLNTTAITHHYGERFVLLNAPVFIEVPTSWIGRTILLRAVSNGTAGEANDSQEQTWDPALIQTEWQPESFVGTRDGSNNVSISWTGRARMGSSDDPIHSVNFLGYRVRITKGATTIEKPVTSTQYYSYTAAQQTADFGGATGTLTIAIAAMNRITGASAELTGTIP